MKLFVANSTRSTFIFNVRVPEIQKVIRLEIPSGQQRSFPLDMTDSQRDGVLSQLLRYGARERKDVHGKLVDFTGLVYSLDKPISENEIRGAHEDQLDAAQERSVEQATRSALASDISHRDKSNPKGKRRPKSTSVEILKKDRDGGREEPMMNLEITEKGAANARGMDPAVKASLHLA